ncbi:MAG TPA: phosphatidylglycerol lysyltransferase domain-containing protein, partial [Candidatus Limnocylindria bacterium]|nr:phosphatidylglycerol lysyltransferase domain-containing protein [Candidatus Limnocylindria bacterium]
MSITPVTLTFAPIRLMDKPWMDEALNRGHRGSLEYNFTANFIWSEVYKLSAARFEDRLVVKSEADPDGPTFIFPSGEGPVGGVVRALAEYTQARGVPLVFNTLLNEDREKLEAEFPGKFRVEADRKDFDYVYEAQKLISLSGKKLSSKRNHVNRFMQDNREWSY